MGCQNGYFFQIPLILFHYDSNVMFEPHFFLFFFHKYILE